MHTTIAVRRARVHVFRYPLSNVVKTSFGIMRHRPMVLVEVEDKDGAIGLGEVWCNFPAVGAEHRARLVNSVLIPLLTSQTYDAPRDSFQHLSSATAVLALQSAEAGPFAQAIAGIDLAIWDMAARKAGEPLWRFLNPNCTPTVGVYASGLNPDAPERMVATKLAEGYTTFKLKIGFGLDRDLANLRAIRDIVGPASPLMVDANQAWDLETALRCARSLEAANLAWLEEPLRCDRPLSEWRALAAKTRIPIAGGENLLGMEAFATAIDSGAFGVVQPDVAKWGGFSGCLPLARAILAAGKRFCPHYLGGGIGLLASAHLLAAAGGDGLLEIDANDNPLRTLLGGPLASIMNGRATLGPDPGLAPLPDLAMLEEYRVPWN
jgi:D-galactarolactone cycloisomerase